MAIYVDINPDAETATIKTSDFRAAVVTTTIAAAAWFLAVILSAQQGWLAAIYQPIIGLIVAATIVSPFAIYARSDTGR